MGTQRNGAAQRRAAAVTPNAIQAYLDRLTAKGRGASTVKNYSNKLTMFYQELPEGKQVTEQVLLDWRQSLLERGYSPNTVNTYLTAVNGLLEYMGRRDLQLVGQLDAVPEIQPELTRTEYLRLLETARTLERERIYLVVKVFALTGIRVGELPLLTAEAVETGWLSVSGEQRPIPGCLRRELLDYIARNGIRSGPVFVSRNGRSLQRTQVTAEIQSLSRDARVEAAKCTPRGLQRLYRATQAEIENDIRLLTARSYEQMLNTEQLAVGWENT